MLSFVAVLDKLSLGFCIVVTEESFCSASTVGLSASNKFRSSIEGSEVAVIVLVGELNAAIKIETMRKPVLTHMVRSIDSETKEDTGANEHTKRRYSRSRIEPLPNFHMKQ